jgi:hypothetical protein
VSRNPLPVHGPPRLLTRPRTPVPGESAVPGGSVALWGWDYRELFRTRRDAIAGRNPVGSGYGESPHVEEVLGMERAAALEMRRKARR